MLKIKNWNKLVGRRILCVSEGSLLELRILEVSDSQDHIKFRDMIQGIDFWISSLAFYPFITTGGYSVIEVLDRRKLRTENVVEEVGNVKAEKESLR